MFKKYWQLQLNRAEEFVVGQLNEAEEFVVQGQLMLFFDFGWR